MAARRMLCLLMALRAEAALYVLDPTDWAADLGEDLDWATANAPFVRLPGYPAIERVFYYRWRVVKKHIVPIDGGSVITEFLPRVPWAGAHNTIPAAAGHHIAETALTTLVNAIRLEAGASPVGFINPTLYASEGAFANDVASGNNKCVAENEFCCDEGFAARGGWDATTGWGSVHFPAYEKVLTADLAPDAVERAKARLRARGAAKKKAAPS